MQIHHWFQVYRGPTAFNYDPVPIYMQSLCDQDIYSIVNVVVNYVRPCAKAEFYLDEFKSFNVKSKTFDITCRINFDLLYFLI